jgi:hypothetical protein
MEKSKVVCDPPDWFLLHHGTLSTINGLHEVRKLRSVRGESYGKGSFIYVNIVSMSEVLSLKR